MEFLGDTVFWSDLLWGLFHLLRKVFLVLIPVVIVLEILSASRIFTWLIDRVHIAGRWLGFQKESISSLMTGILFGITLGAGVLIAEAKAKNLSRRQTLLVGSFLSICHAVFEDTIIFMAVGASGLVMLGTRIPAAILVVFILSLFLRSGLLTNREKI